MRAEHWKSQRTAACARGAASLFAGCTYGFIVGLAVLGASNETVRRAGTLVLWVTDLQGPTAVTGALVLGVVALVTSTAWLIIDCMSTRAAQSARG